MNKPQPDKLERQARHHERLRARAKARLEAAGVLPEPGQPSRAPALAEPTRPLAPSLELKRAFDAVIMARGTRRMMRTWSRGGMRAAVEVERRAVLAEVVERLGRDGYRADGDACRTVEQLFSELWAIER